MNKLALVGGVRLGALGAGGFTLVSPDVKVRVVRGVVPWPGIEDDIRARYEAWCESGEEIFLGLE